VTRAAELSRALAHLETARTALRAALALRALAAVNKAVRICEGELAAGGRPVQPYLALEAAEGEASAPAGP
jgi:hypothetical protein